MSTAPALIASTGVPGLDEILGGGFPHDHVFLIQGDPGAGKTTLGLALGGTWEEREPG